MEHTRIPRAEWSDHPRYPEQTLLLRSHERFRGLALEVSALAEAAPRDAERLFRRWMNAMASHEAYEEQKLYRYLTKRWGVSMAPLCEGHEALGVRKIAVFDAFAAGESGGLREALVAFTETLRAHLELEEDTVIPLLLQLSPQEFEAYYWAPVPRS